MKITRTAVAMLLAIGTACEDGATRAEINRLRSENAALKAEELRLRLERAGGIKLPLPPFKEVVCDTETVRTLDPAGTAKIEAEIAERRAKFETAKEAFEKMLEEAEKLPEPPAGLGSMPETNVVVEMSVGKLGSDFWDGTCRALNTWELAKFTREVSTWNLYVVNVLRTFNTFVKERDPENATRRTNDAHTAQMLSWRGGIGDSAIQATAVGYRVVNWLAKDPGKTKWLTDLAGTFLDEDSKKFAADRLRSAWRASQTDFAALNKEMAAAEAKAEKENAAVEAAGKGEYVDVDAAYDFGPSGEGDYMTGVLLRRYLEREATANGGGNLWIKEVRAALKYTAAGMKIPLQ